MSVNLVKNRDYALNEVFSLEEEVQSTEIEVIEAEESPKSVAIVKSDEEVQEEEDFQKARKTQLNVLSIAEQALEGLLDLAQSSDSPRAYEVLSKMMKDTSDIAATLNNLKKTRTETVTKTETKNTQNNNFFVGSTAELQKLLKGMKDSNETKEI